MHYVNPSEMDKYDIESVEIQTAFVCVGEVCLYPDPYTAYVSFC